MSSAWPPQLKAWVQECLSKATTANKAAVNAELKQILWKAHGDGAINTTDWTKVQLDSLKAQANRTNVSASPAYTPVATKKEKKQNKKRKSENAASSFPTPYHFESNEESEAKARRAARFQREAEAEARSQRPTNLDAWFNPDADSGGVTLSSRITGMDPHVGRKKFRGKGGLGIGEAEPEVDPNVMDWDKYTLKGTSTRLEKKYLRLTSEPNPADVRPLPVLKQTLQLLKAKWRENHNYAYAVDQFKSMRQDLTVQRIKNEFTVEVYEIHARIALEAKDLGEYNQCQSMLRQLYELGIQGHPAEFLAYRILYMLHTRNRSDLASLLGQLTPREKEDPSVHHALQVQAALATSNYTRFFRLFLDAPNMGAYIMDHFVERERAQALAVMSKAYLSLPLPYLTNILAMDGDEDMDIFLIDHDMAMYTNHPPKPPARDPANPWKPLSRPPDVPLAQRVWNCKAAHAMCAKAVDKYRVVDLKGQVDAVTLR